jgi:hypothetical protein
MPRIKPDVLERSSLEDPVIADALGRLGYTRVRYSDLAKNAGRIVTPFAPSNLWTLRRERAGARCGGP